MSDTPSVRCDACKEVFASERLEGGGWRLIDAQQLAERKDDGTVWVSNLFHVGCSPAKPQTWRMSPMEPTP